MISDIFLKILNLSIGAVPIMAALLILRLLFKKAVPRKVFYIAWALVFLRLMVPFSLESNLSFFNFVPKAEVVEENIGTSVVFVKNENERVEFPVYINPENENPNVDWVYHSAITGEIVTGPDITTVPMDKNLILGTIWIFGTAGLLIFGIIGYFAVLRKTNFESVPYTKNIRLSDFFKTPIVCGLFRPKIILPMNFDLDDEAKITSVIAHECTHIRRGDNFWRLLASFTLYVHWFNPLVWLCYDAFIRDMEVSCDEEVLGKSKSDIRGEYAESLVSLSGSGTNPLYGGVLSFGESAIKERVKCIMNFKKATVFILIICVMAAVALGVIFLTNPSVLEEGEQSVSYKTAETESSKAVYSMEKGLEIEVTIKNTDDKTIWLGPATYIYSTIEGNKNVFVGVYGNGGVLMIPKGEEALFCDTIPSEKFHESVRYNLPAGEYILEREVYFDEGLTPTKLYAEFRFEIRESNSLETTEDIIAFIEENPDLLELIENPAAEDSSIDHYRTPMHWEKYKANNPEIPDVIIKFFYLYHSTFATLEVPDFSGLDKGTGNFYKMEQYLKYQVARERLENDGDYVTDFELEIKKESGDVSAYVYSCKYNYKHKNARSSGRNESGGVDTWKFVLLENPETGKEEIELFEWKQEGYGGLYPGLENIFDDIKMRYYPHHNNDYELIANIGIVELLKENGYFGNNSGESLIRYDLSGKVLSGSIAKDYIPSVDFPEEQILGDANMAEYYRTILKGICSGTTKLRVGGITFILQPSDENIVKEMDADGAGVLMSMIERINVMNVEPMPNPNTGGLIEIYLETESNIYRIAYDGRLVLSQRGGEYAHVFDGEFIKDVFGEIQNHGVNLLLGDENNPPLGLGYGTEEPGEANPQIGYELNAFVSNEFEGGGKYFPADSVLPNGIVWGDSKEADTFQKFIGSLEAGNIKSFMAAFTPAGGSGKTVTIGGNRVNELLKLLKKIELTSGKPQNPTATGGIAFHIVTNDDDYIVISSDLNALRISIKGQKTNYYFNATDYSDEIWNIMLAMDEMINSEKDIGQVGATTAEAHLIPDEVESFATLFSNASKTAARSYIADELRDLLIYRNLTINPNETDSSALGNPLSKVDVIEFIREDNGSKYTLELYEKGFILKGSAVPEGKSGQQWIAEDDTWEYFIDKINSEFENAYYVIPYWFGLVSPKRVKEVVVFGENSEKYSYTQKDDSFDNFFSIFKSDIKVSSVKERFEGNKLPDAVSEDCIRIKIYFETGTIYEILAEQDYITMVSSDMSYGLRYNLAVKSNAYDAFLDYSKGGPINAVTG